MLWLRLHGYARGFIRLRNSPGRFVKQRLSRWLLRCARPRKIAILLRQSPYLLARRCTRQSWQPFVSALMKLAATPNQTIQLTPSRTAFTFYHDEIIVISIQPRPWKA